MNEGHEGSDGSAGVPGPDEIWQRWTERDDRDQDARAFARGFPGAESEVLRTLELMLGLERRGPLPSLVPEGPEGWAEEGLLFAGYRLVRLIGQGTFGRVFEAEDERDGSRLALKILNPLIASAAAGKDVIQREARIARDLDHEGIVRFLDSGEHRGYAWIATELFDGVPLSELPLGDGSPAERREAALEIGVQVARALAYSHEKGIIHRDLKPANVLVDAEGLVKVLDYGLAHSQGTVLAISATGKAVGTPLYMAPEQARGDSTIGPQADLYSLALILLELASGERLAHPTEGLRALMRLARGHSLAPRRMWKGIEPGLASVLRRCLEPHPLDRLPSAAHLETALLDVQRGRKSSFGTLNPAARWARRVRRNLAAATAWALLVAVIGWVTWYMWWNAPVPVRVDALLSGKLLFVDGVERGLVPVTLQLRPGRHRYELVFGNLEEGDVFRGVLDIPHRRKTYEFVALNYWQDRPVIPVFEPPSPQGELAWVNLATPQERIRLQIAELGFDQVVEGIIRFQLPMGTHRLRVLADGHRPRDVELVVDDQEMLMVSVELDPIDSEWSTVLAYGPFEANVRETLHVEGLREYCELMRYSAEDAAAVHKVYLGPTVSREPGSASFALDLPVPVGDLQVEVNNDSVIGPGRLGRVLLELGPAPDDLVEFTRFQGVLDSSGAWVIDHRLSGARDALVERMSGKRRIFARYTVEDAPCGDSYSYGCALRTKCLPTRIDGKLMWMPALRIRVRP